MNARACAIVSGLLVTATSAVVVGSATAATTGNRRAVTRMVPNSTESTRPPAAVSPFDLPVIDPAVRAHSDSVVIARWTTALNASRWYASATESISRARAAASTPRPPSGNRGNVLDCIKQRESRGQYGVVNSSSGAAGAYQFMPNTWNNTARSAGRLDLVGVNPSSASAADQDAMAQHLLARQGLGPWGGACG